MFEDPKFDALYAEMASLTQESAFHMDMFDHILCQNSDVNHEFTDAWEDILSEALSYLPYEGLLTVWRELGEPFGARDKSMCLDTRIVHECVGALAIGTSSARDLAIQLMDYPVLPFVWTSTLGGLALNKFYYHCDSGNTFLLRDVQVDETELPVMLGDDYEVLEAPLGLRGYKNLGNRPPLGLGEAKDEKNLRPGCLVVCESRSGNDYGYSTMHYSWKEGVR